MSETVAAAASAAAQVVPAFALVSAAMLKAQSLSDFQRTLHALGVTSLLARSAALGVIAAEFVIGASLLLVPSSPWPRLALGLLAVGFAAAGVKAIAGKHAIACHCLGAIGSRTLGWRQVALLPVWFLLAGIAQLRPPVWAIDQGALALGVLLLILIGTQLPREIPVWRQLHADRLAIVGALAEASQPGKGGGDHQ